MSLNVEHEITITSEDGSVIVKVLSDKRARVRVVSGRDAVELMVPFDDLPAFAEAVDKAYRRVCADEKADHVVKVKVGSEF